LLPHDACNNPQRYWVPPSVDENEESFVIKDASGQALAYIYFEDNESRRSVMDRGNEIKLARAPSRAALLQLADSRIHSARPLGNELADCAVATSVLRIFRRACGAIELATPFHEGEKMRPLGDCFRSGGKDSSLKKQAER